MKNKIILLSFFIVFFGCYKDIDLYTEKNYKPQIAINSIFIPDSSIQIRISESALPTMLDSEYLCIDVDTLKIYAIRNGQKILINKKVNFISPYQTNYKIKTDEDYYVEVSAIDKKASAYIEIPDVVTVDSFLVEYNGYEIDTSNLFATLFFNVSLTFNDPDTENYYLAYIYYYGPQYDPENDTFRMEKISANFFINNLNILHSGFIANYPPYYRGILFTDEHFNGTQVTVDGSINIFMPLIPTKNIDNLTLYLQFFTFSKAIKKYYETKRMYEASLYNPFMEPVNIYTNVKDGYGIVSGVNYYLDSVVLNPSNFNKGIW